MRPILVKGSKYLSQWFYKQYTAKYFTIEQWFHFLKINYLDYCDVKICSNQLTSLLENGSVLDQLPFIKELDSDFSKLIAYPPLILQAALAPIGNFIPTINYLPIGLGNGIQDSEFDDNILDTLVPNLMPNLGELELLNHEV